MFLWPLLILSTVQASLEEFTVEKCFGEPQKCVLDNKWIWYHSIMNTTDEKLCAKNCMDENKEKHPEFEKSGKRFYCQVAIVVKSCRLYFYDVGITATNGNSTSATNCYMLRANCPGFSQTDGGFNPPILISGRNGQSGADNSGTSGAASSIGANGSGTGVGESGNGGATEGNSNGHEVSGGGTGRSSNGNGASGARGASSNGSGAHAGTSGSSSGIESNRGGTGGGSENNGGTKALGGSNSTGSNKDGTSAGSSSNNDNGGGASGDTNSNKANEVGKGGSSNGKKDKGDSNGGSSNGNGDNRGSAGRSSNGNGDNRVNDGRNSNGNGDNRGSAGSKSNGNGDNRVNDGRNSNGNGDNRGSAGSKSNDNGDNRVNDGRNSNGNGDNRGSAGRNSNGNGDNRGSAGGNSNGKGPNGGGSGANSDSIGGSNALGGSSSSFANKDGSGKDGSGKDGSGKDRSANSNKANESGKSGSSSDNRANGGGNSGGSSSSGRTANNGGADGTKTGKSTSNGGRGATGETKSANGKTSLSNGDSRGNSVNIPSGQKGNATEAEKAKAKALGIDVPTKTQAEAAKPLADVSAPNNLTIGCFTNNRTNVAVRGSYLSFYYGQKELSDKPLDGCKALCIKTNHCVAINFIGKIGKDDDAFCKILSAKCIQNGNSGNCETLNPATAALEYWERGNGCPPTPERSSDDRLIKSGRTSKLGATTNGQGKAVVTGEANEKVRLDAAKGDINSKKCFTNKNTTVGVMGHFINFYAGRKEFDESVTGCMDLCLKAQNCTAINFYPKDTQYAGECVHHSSNCTTTKGIKVCIDLATPTEYWERIIPCPSRIR